MSENFADLEFDAASEEVQSIYADAKRALRVSNEPWLFRILGSHPKFLDVAWIAIKPILTDMFESSADGIREKAMEIVSESLPGVNARESLKTAGIAEGEIDKISENALVFHYVNPKLALLSSALSDSLAGKPPAVTSKVVMPTGRGIPPGMPCADRADVSSVPQALNEYAASFSLATVPDLYLNFAKSPHVLKALWDALKEGLEGGAYQLAHTSIQSEIGEATKLLRRRMDLGAGNLSAHGIELAEQTEIRKKIDAAKAVYLRSVGDAAYVALSLAGPEAANLTGEGFMLRWQFP
jgi:hypothetical protein